jgi:glycosyltransferase involved in cell wall biosynthesis
MLAPRHTHTAPILGLYKGALTQAFYRLAAPLMSAHAPEQVAVTEWEAATVEQFEAARVIITSRVLGGLGEGPTAGRRFVEALQRGGRRVLIDQDDDIHAPAGGRTWPRERLALFEAMLRAADGVICTNATLAGRLKPYGTPVRVVPNYVRPDLWPTPLPAPTFTGATWLLLAGSRSHREDWKEVAPAIARLKAHRADLRLRVVCHELFDYLTPLADDFVPWVPVEQYPATLAGHQIMLCPLPDSRFNRCKSPVKALEAALAGCAVLGSETQYGPLLRAAGLSHAVAAPATWERLIARYLDDPDARSADAAQLRRHVTDRLDARAHAEAIRAAYAA